MTENTKCKSLLAAVLTMAGALNSHGAHAAPEDPLPRAALAIETTTAPKIDGVFNDAVWGKAALESGFVVSPGGARATPNSSFRLAYDSKALYMAIRMDEPEMSKTVGHARKFDDAGIFRDDIVEIFVQPNPNQSVYYHLVVNSNGARRDGAGTDGNVDIPWKSATTRLADGWQVEVEIPFSSLGVAAPKSGSQMRLNICREKPEMKPAGEESIWHNSVWSFLTRGFHEQRDFGYLIFNDYNIVLKQQFDEARKKVAVLQRLLPAGSQTDIAAIGSKLIQPSNVTSEEKFRDGLRLIRSTEEDLNWVLGKAAVPAGATPNLVVAHMNPYDSIAKDRLAQIVYYDSIAANQGGVGLTYRQGINEYEHDAFTISTSTGISNIYINATDLVSASGKRIPAEKVQCNVIGYVNPTAETDFNYSAWNKVPAPDLVEPIRHAVTLNSFESKQIWVTVHSLGTPAGEYKGAVNISDVNGKILRTIPVRVTVSAVTLPVRPALDLYLFTGVPFDGQSGELLADFLVDHYASYVHMELPTDMTVGNKPVLHQERDVKALDLGFDVAGRKISIPGKAWNNFERLKILRSRNLKLNFDTGEGLVPTAILPSFIEYLKKAGYDYKDYRYKISDEDQNDWSLPIFMAYKKTDPKLRLLMIPAGDWDITPYSPWTDEYMSSVSVLAWHKWLPHFQTEWQKKKKPFSVYTNWGSWSGRGTLSQIRADLRFIWNIGAPEFSTWTAGIYPPLNYAYPYHGAPFNDVRKLAPEQQSTSTLIYYRTEGGVHYPISSKRLEAIRDGMTDWMYIKLLSDTLKKSQGKVSAAVQSKGQATLKRVTTDMPATKTQFNAAKYDISKQIIELQAAMSKKPQAATIGGLKPVKASGKKPVNKP